MLLRRVFTLLVAIVALSFTARRAEAQAILWSTKAPMPTPRIYFGAAVVDGKIYALGGHSGSTLARNEVYDPALDTWTVRAPMPTPRVRLVVAAVGGKIYAIGGYQLSGSLAEPVYANEEYDPATDTWTVKADLPHGLSNYINSFVGGGTLGGKIYVFVFNAATPTPLLTYEYDPVADIWRTDRAPAPFSRTNYAAAPLQGRLYVVAAGDAPNGGSFSTGAQLGEYDPASDTWIVRPPTPTVRAALAVAAADGRLWAVGGLSVDHLEPEETFFNSLSTVESYDPVTHQWHAATAMPTPRHTPAVAAVGHKLYVIGGGLTESNSPQETTQPLDVVEEGDLQPPGTSCLPDATTLCIDDLAGDRRFEVTVEYHTTQGGGLSGEGRAVPLGSLGVSSGGLFWFFTANNPEMLIKVLNGCGINQRYWVFTSAGTNVGLTIRVHDAVTGNTWTRNNSDGTAAPTIQDTGALPCN